MMSVTPLREKSWKSLEVRKLKEEEEVTRRREQLREDEKSREEEKKRGKEVTERGEKEK